MVHYSETEENICSVPEFAVFHEGREKFISFAYMSFWSVLSNYLGYLTTVVSLAPMLRMMSFCAFRTCRRSSRCWGVVRTQSERMDSSPSNTFYVPVDILGELPQLNCTSWSEVTHKSTPLLQVRGRWVEAGYAGTILAVFNVTFCCPTWLSRFYQVAVAWFGFTLWFTCMVQAHQVALAWSGFTLVEVPGAGIQVAVLDLVLHQGSLL